MDDAAMIVVSRQFGRLGNRLFIFAHLIAASEDGGAEILNPGFFDYASYFEGTSSNPCCAYPITNPSIRLPIKLRWLLYRAYLWATDLVESCGGRMDFLKSRVEILNAPAGHPQEAFWFELAQHAKAGTVFTNGWKIPNVDGIRRHRAKIVSYLTPY